MSRFLLAVMLPCLFCSTPPHTGYEWRSFPDDTDQIALWRDGRQLGNYRLSTGEYFPQVDDGWGAPTAPPYPPPLYPVQVEADGTLNFGLDRSHPPAQGKHLLNGKEVGKEELLQALGESRLRDDSQWLSLTVIGAEAERKSVLSDLQTSPLLAPWKDRLKVQDYAPQHWAVRDAGFVTAGHPTIYCQAADGTVLHRQDEYRGPEALAEVLRQADPSYRPQRDPDLNRPLSNVPPWIWLAGGLFLFFLLKGDEK